MSTPTALTGGCMFNWCSTGRPVISGSAAHAGMPAVAARPNIQAPSRDAYVMLSPTTQNKNIF
jgi:hypothetical protein